MIFDACAVIARIRLLNMSALLSARRHVFQGLRVSRNILDLYLCSTVDTPISSPLCWNISLFSLIKFFCISDIWAMIFSLRSRAISAFLFLSAFSFSLMSCIRQNRTSHGQPQGLSCTCMPCTAQMSDLVPTRADRNAGGWRCSFSDHLDISYDL